MNTQFELHGLAHVKLFFVVKLKEISILMQLRIISSESDNITDRKLICQADFKRKTIFFHT